MSEQDDIARARGRIISNFAFLEFLISAFISASYFKPDESHRLNQLTQEVFDDEYMSFGLKRNIFYKVLRNRFPELFKTFPKKELEEMRRIRNICAHGLLTAKGKVGSKEVFDISIEHAGKKHSEKLFKEYESLREVIEPIVTTLPGITIKVHFD